MSANKQTNKQKQTCICNGRYNISRSSIQPCLDLCPNPSADSCTLGVTIYSDESKFWQYFGNTRGSIQWLRMVMLSSWRRWTTVVYEMPSSPDTLWVLFTGFKSMSWSTTSESTFLVLTDIAWSSKFLQPEWNFLNYLITVINCAFIFCAIHFIDWFCCVLAQFELRNDKFTN